MDPPCVGFKEVVIRPNPAGDLTHAGAEYESIRGRIVSQWRIENRRFHLRVTIPVNAAAKVLLPAAYSRDVSERGVPASKAEGVKYVGQEGGRPAYSVGSGEYEFTGEATR